MSRRARRTIGGGGTGNPRSLANLRRGGPVKPGNSHARTHGGYAQVAADELDDRVARIFEALRSDAPQTDGPVWLVVLLAEAWVHWEDVRAYRRQYGWRDQETGQPRPAADLERRLRSEIADYIDALGLSPRSAARLGLDLARGYTIADAMSERDPERRAHMLRELDVEGDGDG